MAQLWRYLAVAAGADVGLESLIGLDSSNFNGAVESVPNPQSGGLFLGSHRKSEFQPKKAQRTNAVAAKIAAATKT